MTADGQQIFPHTTPSPPTSFIKMQVLAHMAAISGYCDAHCAGSQVALHLSLLFLKGVNVRSLFFLPPKTFCMYLHYVILVSPRQRVLTPMIYQEPLLLPVISAHTCAHSLLCLVPFRGVD